MTCVPNVPMSGPIVVQIVDLSGLSYGRGTQALKSASVSCAIQSIVTLVHQLSMYESYLELKLINFSV